MRKLYSFCIQFSLLIISLFSSNKFYLELNKIKQTARLREDEVKKLQKLKLNKLLMHAVRNVPYYRKLGLKNISIENFPILDKKILKVQGDLMISENHNKSKLIKQFEKISHQSWYKRRHS